MIFSNEKPIYLQMADRLMDEILAGNYKDDDRIPSVREYSVLLEVNTNTAVTLLIFVHYWAAYKLFTRMQVINNKWLNV